MTDHFEKIEKYLGGKMSSEESEAFLKERSFNQDIQDDFDLFGDMQDYLKDQHSIESSLQSLKEVHNQKKETPGSRPSTTSGMKYFLLVLLLGLISAGVYYVLSNRKQPVEPDVLYAMNFDPAPISLSTRSENSDKRLVTLEDLFNSAQYNDVITLLKTENVSKIDDPKVNYLKGISLLGIGDYTTSRQVLYELKEQHSIYTDDVNWYIGLGYLREGDVQKAQSVFSMIPKNHKRYSQAQKILNNYSR